MYNQRMFLKLFNLPDVGAARRHFRTLNKRSMKGKRNGFAHSLRGLGDRLDVILMNLKLAPTIY